MNLHEYQGKELMAYYGLPVVDGRLCYSAGEVEAAVDSLASPVVVIKAQVHAGGRGKAGGVKLAKSAAEARSVAEQMIGMKLVTKQTGEAGKLVRKVYVESGCNIDREFYLSLLVDRASRSLSLVASAQGGMDIEEVAHSNPEAIIKVGIDPNVGLQKFQSLELLLKLGLDLSMLESFSEILEGLYECFNDNDLSMVEINPLVLTKEKTFIVLDAKVAVDDNALFRHTELRELMDYDELDARDLRASKFGLSYVGLDGNIGCMVNGAGLAMATMDIIKQAGGEPANFLDVGGGASKETVTEAFKILLSDSNVEGILVNIFGGIMRCDVIANGVVEAARELGVKVPLVVRLQGTNVDLGRKILSESGLKITPVNTMSEAAEAIVKAVRG